MPTSNLSKGDDITDDGDLITSIATIHNEGEDPGAPRRNVSSASFLETEKSEALRLASILPPDDTTRGDPIVVNTTNGESPLPEEAKRESRSRTPSPTSLVVGKGTAVNSNDEQANQSKRGTRRSASSVPGAVAVSHPRNVTISSEDTLDDDDDDIEQQNVETENLQELPEAQALESSETGHGEEGEYEGLNDEDTGDIRSGELVTIDGYRANPRRAPGSSTSTTRNYSESTVGGQRDEDEQEAAEERMVRRVTEKFRQTTVMAEGVTTTSTISGALFSNLENVVFCGVPMKWWIIGTCVLIFLLVATVVGLGVQFSSVLNDDDGPRFTMSPTMTMVPTESPTNYPTLVPTMQPTLDKIDPIISLLSSRGIMMNDVDSIKDDMSTPQYKALYWLVYQDTFDISSWLSSVTVDDSENVNVTTLQDSSSSGDNTTTTTNDTETNTNTSSSSTTTTTASSSDYYSIELHIEDLVIERYALAVLYFATEGYEKNWVNSFGWDDNIIVDGITANTEESSSLSSSSSVCDWYGITCYDSTNTQDPEYYGYVGSIDLGKNVISLVPFFLFRFCSLN